MSYQEDYTKLGEQLNSLVSLESRLNSLMAYCKKALATVDDKERELLISEIRLKSEFEKKFNDLMDAEKGFNKIIEQRSKGLPWLANAIAEFIYFKDVEVANLLERKKHPSIKGAEAVKAKGAENKILRKQLRIASSFVNYYETLVPWLKDYREEDLSDLLKEIENDEKIEKQEEDPVLNFIPRSEYKILSEEDRNQKALDRYMAFRNKSTWRLGRDYERYIGYLYESNGYRVSYEGIIKGFFDLGRDLVCKRDNEIEIVQCKYWSKLKKKVIHEKYINQLYGTVVKYYLDHKQQVSPETRLRLFPEMMKSGEIKATFITSTVLSPTAKDFADALGIRVVQDKPLEKYPIIKCNVAINGEKIYHLPFDQQYDSTVISKPDEFYAMTVKEAIDRGFRRAFRWSGK